MRVGAWPGRSVAACLLAGLLALPAAAQPPAFSLTLLQSALPSPRDCTTAVWDGARYAYVFGGDSSGWNTFTDDIVRFEPATGNVTLLPARLPVPAGCATAFWAGGAAYVLGGWGSGTANVVRFDPVAMTVTVMGSHLPADLAGASLVWDGSAAYVLGGIEGMTGGSGTFTDKIWKYVPATDTLTLMPSRLPVARAWMGAAWSGSQAVLFSGMDDWGWAGLSFSWMGVVTYDPATGAVAVVPNVPLPGFGRVAVSDGSAAYLFGGLDPDSPSLWLTNVLRYDFATATVAATGAVLPSGRSAMSGVWAGCGAYLFGGSQGHPPAPRYADILRYAPAGCFPVPPPPPPPPPVPSLSFSWRPDDPACRAGALSFAAAGSGAPFSGFAWDFGDGGAAAGERVEHTFAALGSYHVTLGATANGTPYAAARDVAVALPPPCPPTLDPMPLITVTVGDLALACAHGHAGMAGELSYSAADLPEGAALSADGACLSWTPDREGLVPCVRFTATERPSGLSASGCQAIRVTPLAVPSPDGDLDGIPDAADDCPTVPDRGQEDADGDGHGDACQAAAPGGALLLPPPAGTPRLADRDGDGVPDAGDLCPGTADRLQADLDGDGVGDACDLDVDGDGVANALDACPTLASAGCGAAGTDSAPLLPPRAQPVPMQSPAWQAGAPWAMAGGLAVLGALAPLRRRLLPGR